MCTGCEVNGTTEQQRIWAERDAETKRRNRTKKPVVQIRRPDDDHILILVNGKEVTWANYDEHGSDSMEAIIETAAEVGKALGARVVIE